jgi:hypothetical protein
MKRAMGTTQKSAINQHIITIIIIIIIIVKFQAISMLKLFGNPPTHPNKLLPMPLN